MLIQCVLKIVFELDGFIILIRGKGTFQGFICPFSLHRFYYDISSNPCAS